MWNVSMELTLLIDLICPSCQRICLQRDHHSHDEKQRCHTTYSNDFDKEFDDQFETYLYLDKLNIIERINIPATLILSCNRAVPTDISYAIIRVFNNGGNRIVRHRNETSFSKDLLKGIGVIATKSIEHLFSSKEEYTLEEIAEKTIKAVNVAICGGAFC
jgi:hypothetical protein